MTSELKRSFNLPFGYAATFVWAGDGALMVCWEPGPPQIRNERAQRQFFKAYKAARQDFYTEIAALVGGACMIIDVGNKKYEGVEVVRAPVQH